MTCSGFLLYWVLRCRKMGWRIVKCEKCGLEVEGFVVENYNGKHTWRCPQCGHVNDLNNVKLSQAKLFDDDSPPDPRSKAVCGRAYNCEHFSYPKCLVYCPLKVIEDED